MPNFPTRQCQILKPGTAEFSNKVIPDFQSRECQISKSDNNEFPHLIIRRGHESEILDKLLCSYQDVFWCLTEICFAVLPIRARLSLREDINTGKLTHGLLIKVAPYYQNMNTRGCLILYGRVKHQFFMQIKKEKARCILHLFFPKPPITFFQNLCWARKPDKRCKKKDYFFLKTIVNLARKVKLEEQQKSGCWKAKTVGWKLG